MFNIQQSTVLNHEIFKMNFKKHSNDWSGQAEEYGDGSVGKVLARKEKELEFESAAST